MELEREQEKHSQTRTKELERQQTGAASAFFAVIIKLWSAAMKKSFGTAYLLLLEQDYYKSKGSFF